jgi:hypothetical protein
MDDHARDDDPLPRLRELEDELRGLERALRESARDTAAAELERRAALVRAAAAGAAPPAAG